MSVGECARDYPFVFGCWSILTLGQLYITIAACRDTWQEFRKLQRKMQDLRRMKEILREIYEDGRRPVEAYEAVERKK